MRRLLQFIATRPQGAGESYASYAARLLSALPSGAVLLAVVVAGIERSFERVQLLMQADMDLMLAA